LVPNRIQAGRLWKPRRRITVIWVVTRGLVVCDRTGRVIGMSALNELTEIAPHVKLRDRDTFKYLRHASPSPLRPMGITINRGG
jgi:hypothetical protein